MKKVNLVALWILGIIVFAAAIAVAQYYYYITPPSDLRISPNACFSKSTKAQVIGMLNSNLATNLYNNLGSNTQSQTSVSAIQKMLTSSMKNTTVSSVNHDTGSIGCTTTFKTTLKSPNENKSYKASATGVYTINGTKTGTVYWLTDSVLSTMYRRLNNS